MASGAAILPFRVLNLRHPGISKASGTYIGRPGLWGNPFSIGKDGTREEVVEQYRSWLLVSTLMDDLHQLKGCNLVCWSARSCQRSRPLPGSGLLIRNEVRAQ
jgi:hypothetical protein